MPPGLIIPELVYADLERAVEWLCATFGFVERLRIGDHRSQLCFGEASIVAIGQSAESCTPSGLITHSVMARVESVDRHYERAQRCGARILRAPETYPFGERQYSVEDIGGHRWTFSESVADVAPETWGGSRPRLST